jgi:hypothetical protein
MNITKNRQQIDRSSRDGNMVIPEFNSASLSLELTCSTILYQILLQRGMSDMNKKNMAVA